MIRLTYALKVNEITTTSQFDFISTIIITNDQEVEVVRR